MAKLEEGMEVCESCEVHENLLKIVNEKMPEETLLLVETYIDGKLHVFDKD